MSDYPIDQVSYFLKYEGVKRWSICPGMPHKPIDRNLKTSSVTVLKLMEGDVTLTLFVTDLSYPGLSFFYRICEIDPREGAESLALIFAFVLEISQENEKGALKRRILLSRIAHTIIGYNNFARNLPRGYAYIPIM